MANPTDTTQIQTLTTKQLKAKIAELTGKTSKSNNRPYLIRKLTKALEAAAAEAPKRTRTAKQAKSKKAKGTTKRRKTESAEETKPRRKRRRTDGERDPRLPAPGTVIEREYKGETIEVEVLEDGFRYGGETYGSLSTIAREATGTIWNGYVFFRLASPAKRDQAAA